MNSKDKNDRLLDTAPLSDFLSIERERIFSKIDPKQLDTYREAEQAHKIYKAWNTVCAGTREGKHVTGLKYIPEHKELIVYTDNAVWTQEINLLREIIRARMERAGAYIEKITTKTTKHPINQDKNKNS